MTGALTKTSWHENQLLGAFEPAARKRLKRYLRPVNLKVGTVICLAGGSLEYAYFPQGSVLSLLTVLEDGSASACANIGREGCVRPLRRHVQPCLL